MTEAPRRAGRGPPAHRRQARRGELGGHVRQHRPHHRGGAGRHRRRHRAGHGAAPSARRGAPSTRPTWSTDHELRRRCLEQFHAACAAHIEELRAVDRGRGGQPHRAHLRQPGRPAHRRPGVLGRQARPLPVRALAARARRLRPAPAPAGAARAGRGGRGHHAVELPPQPEPRQAGPGPGRGQHRRAQARPRHPVVGHGAGPDHRRGDRHPRRGGQRGGVVGPHGGRGAHHRPARGHDHLHGVDGHGPAHHGQGRRRR